MEVVGSTFLRIQRIRHDEISLPTEIDIAWFSEDTPTESPKLQPQFFDDFICQYRGWFYYQRATINQGFSRWGRSLVRWVRRVSRADYDRHQTG